MKSNILFSIFSVLLGLTFVSCDKDNDADTTKPVIKLEEPANGEVLRIGGDVHFEAEFSDDVMLGSYLVEIHSNFDGHSHKAPSSRATSEEVPFFFKKSYDLSGKRNSHEHHHDIVIPEKTKPGNYHFMVYCTDAAGNQTLVSREVVLSHDAEEHHHED